MSEQLWLRVAGAHSGWAGVPLPFGMCPSQVGTWSAGVEVRGPRRSIAKPVLLLLTYKSCNFSEP